MGGAISKLVVPLGLVILCAVGGFLVFGLIRDQQRLMQHRKNEPKPIQPPPMPDYNKMMQPEKSPEWGARQ